MRQREVGILQAVGLQPVSRALADVRVSPQCVHPLHTQHKKYGYALSKPQQEGIQLMHIGYKHENLT